MLSLSGDLIVIFEEFKNYEEIEIGEAPGPEIPNRPLIDLPPELEGPNNDFVPPTKDKPTKDKPAEDKPAEEKPIEPVRITADGTPPFAN